MELIFDGVFDSRAHREELSPVGTDWQFAEEIQCDSQEQVDQMELWQITEDSRILKRNENQ